MKRRYLKPSEARAFYDRIGPGLDRHRLYEKDAIDLLIKKGAFDRAEAVFELGCGTGLLAEELLERFLPEGATYTAVDISPVMVATARKRLERFGPRVKIFDSDGSLGFDFPASSFDRFIATYVLDLLSPKDIEKVFAGAKRILKKDGKICLASLTKGVTLLSRILVALWDMIHLVNPRIVGGCRPVTIERFLNEKDWQVEFHSVVTTWGVPTEVVVAGVIKGA